MVPKSARYDNLKRRSEGAPLTENKRNAFLGGSKRRAPRKLLASLMSQTIHTHGSHMGSKQLTRQLDERPRPRKSRGRVSSKHSIAYVRFTATCSTPRLLYNQECAR